MRPIRYLLIILAALMLLSPAAVAAGPSAGDQPYTDPLAGSNGSNSSSNGSASNGSSSSTPASSGSSSSAASSASSSTSATPAALTPPATTAQATGSTLPRTGFNAWVGAAFGVALLGAGLAVRRQVHRT